MVGLVWEVEEAPAWLRLCAAFVLQCVDHTGCLVISEGRLKEQVEPVGVCSRTSSGRKGGAIV